MSVLIGMLIGLGVGAVAGMELHEWLLKRRAKRDGKLIDYYQFKMMKKRKAMGSDENN